MKKKNLFLGVLLASAVFGLAACNGTGNTSGTSGEVTTPTTSTDTTPTVEKFTVTFDSKGGSSVTSVEVEKGGKVTKPTNPTKDADNVGKYVFAGWYKDASFNNAFNFDSDTITAATTLYAKWDVFDRLTVTFNVDGGSDVDLQYVYKGEKVTKPATDPTKTEDDNFVYAFGGWYADAALTTEFKFNETEITTTTTIYAKWEKTNKYLVTFDTNNYATVDGQRVVDGGKATRPTTDPTTDHETEDYYYVFGGWYADDKLTTEFKFDETTITEPTTVYAKWNQVEKVIVMNGKKYSSIAKALAAIPTKDDTNTYTIILPAGTYNENGLVYEGSATVHIKGDTTAKYGSDVIIKGHGSNMAQEKTRNLISIRGTGNIILENLTLESDWTRTLAGGNNAQAEVLGTDTKGNTVAYNCSFKSHQDTLRTAGKAWFYGCYIEGDVDFMWMEQAGTVALYENCEIVSVYDSTATSHGTYFAAPRMTKTTKVGKGLVIYNSVLKETTEAKENGQATYLARNPWSGQTDYYNQVAYINTAIEATINEKVWYNNPTATELEKTAIGFKMDAATAATISYAGNGDILSAADVTNEFSGREAIINRVYHTGKMKYEQDQINYWDINALIESYGWTVDADTSKSVLPGEEGMVSIVYKFDGTQDLSALTVEGFSAHSSGSYVGGAGSTIKVPVTGKCYVEVYGFYSGTAETSADTQGVQVMFFNNGSTGSEVENDYIVYDANATEVTIAAKGTTYITKIVVCPDDSIEQVAVTSMEDISTSTKNYCVGVPLTLSVKVNPGTASNKSVLWSSSDETIATIDKYTGKVTFLKAGEVTFTVAATDGSNISKSITLNPVEAKWVKAEWYSADKDDLSTEDGAIEIGVFDTAGTAYKDLKGTYSFTNLSGKTITTGFGLKQNSSGKLLFNTTKGNATLTVITVKGINAVATPKVSDGSKDAPLLSSTENSDGTITYVYSIDYAAAWTICRGDETKECNPILYAKVEYDLTISKSTFVNFKHGSYSIPTGETELNHNNDGEGSSKIESANEITFDNITYKGCQSNGNNNWLIFNTGSTITFTAKSACTLYVYYYNGTKSAKVTLDGTEVETTTSSEGASYATGYAYNISAGGTVVIEGTSNWYLGAFEVAFPTNS